MNKHVSVWKSHLIQLYRSETLNQQCFPNNRLEAFALFVFGNCLRFALPNIKEEKKMKEAAQKKIEAREC